MNKVKLTFFYGGCPLCKREDDFLQSRNQRGCLKFIDINNSNFFLELKYGISYKHAMERIHALKNNASVIKDIKLFQEAYSLISLGWIYASTKLPILINFLSLYMGYGQNID